MPTIYRRRGSEDLLREYLAASERTEKWKEHVRRTTIHRVSPDAQAEFISKPNSRVISSFVFRATVQRKALVHDGWRHVSTRRAIEPRVGEPGRPARSLLAEIWIPTDQPGHILNEAGLPETYSAHGEERPVEWMFCDGSLWFTIPSAGTVTGLEDGWEHVTVTDYSALQERWARDGADALRHNDPVPTA